MKHNPLGVRLLASLGLACPAWSFSRPCRPKSRKNGPVRSVAFSPDGKTLASASSAKKGTSDDTIKLWDVQTGKEQATLKGHTGNVWSVAFSPDGKTLASASGDGTIRCGTWRRARS